MVNGQLQDHGDWPVVGPKKVSQAIFTAFCLFLLGGIALLALIVGVIDWLIKGAGL